MRKEKHNYTLKSNRFTKNLKFVGAVAMTTMPLPIHIQIIKTLHGLRTKGIIQVV